jgi:hypothetical protein
MESINVLKKPRTTKIKIIFNGIEFEKLGDFEKYVKILIYDKIGYCDSVKLEKNAFYDELNLLLKRHPEYITKTEKMIDFKISYDLLNIKALKILILNNDGSETDISWRVAIKGIPKTSKQDLFSALRTTIMPQIYNFRKKNENICEYCKKTEELHVDHVIHFEEIAQNFLNKMNLEGVKIPDNFDEIDNGTHLLIFDKKDKKFRDSWYDYHQENAILRILCKSCNLTRTKKIYKK